ncbi:hypothetical protein JXQ31_04040 [candidate division KSB1 bacterium]|nr:hypothetical protein [candidate division KSB1 bacterium]
MSKIAAVKIVLESGDLYFYEDEVLDVIDTPLKHFQVQTGDNNLPQILSDGDSWRVIQMTIRESAPDTRSRINFVLDEKNVMSLYYVLPEDPSMSARVFLLPDSNEFRYYNGDKAAGIDFQFTFLECE